MLSRLTIRSAVRLLALGGGALLVGALTVALTLLVAGTPQTASTELRFTQVETPQTAEATANATASAAANVIPANDGLLLGEESAEGRDIEQGTGPPATEGGAASGGELLLDAPSLGIEGLPVPTGSGQAALDREGLLHLDEAGDPWEPGSNTYIAGHAVGYEQTRVPYVFYELEELRAGDEVSLTDPAGREYTYRVYETLVVEPEDYWVTYPVPGETTLTLQTCTPIPSFEDRLVVRAELVS